MLQPFSGTKLRKMWKDTSNTQAVLTMHLGIVSKILDIIEKKYSVGISGLVVSRLKSWWRIDSKRISRQVRGQLVVCADNFKLHSN